MPENTLLSLLTGGRYGTSEDLPTIPETAHSFMDDLIANQDSQMPQVLFPAGKNIFGQPTQPFTREDLESLMMGIVMPGQGAKSIIPGSEGWKQIMTRLRLINPASSDKLNRMSELIRGRPSTSLNPKYKDNPYQELADIMDDVFKPLEDINIGGRIPSEYFPSRVRKLQSSELTGKAREAEKILNKSLLEGFEELNEFSKRGLTGYMPQKYEEKIRKWSNTLLDLIK